MSRPTLIASACVVAVAAILGFLLVDEMPRAPSRERCVELWNSPRNAGPRDEVVALGYPSAEIEGAFSEGRYQGCFATFASEVGEPWALYSAVRIPGTDRPLRWTLDIEVERWGVAFSPPRDEPRPNAIVEPDGSLSLT